MKLKIGISLLNSSGSVALLENEDEMERVSFAITNSSRNAKKLCQNAAKQLRECALRFEKLANEPEPFKYETQERVNKN